MRRVPTLWPAASRESAGVPHVWRRTHGSRRRRRRFQPMLEGMEDRTVLSSTVLVDGLEFTGTFAQGTNSYTSTGTVLIGYAPTQSEAFNPLLSTSGLVTIPTSTSATTFTIGPSQGAASASLTLD